MDKRVKEKLNKLLEAVKARRAVLLILLAGLVILLIPTGRGEETAKVQPETAALRESPEALEARLEAILSKIDGAGRVEVLLTLGDDGERVLARDSGSTRDGERWEEETDTVTVSQGSGKTSEVEVSYRYPVYRGAVICAEGAGSAQVRLELTEAVRAATGLGSDAIKIVKMGATP